MEKFLLITPRTKVGELLDAYPQLEKVLMDMSPAFEKLKNPVLRRTVARVATLAQIAVVGGLKVEDIVNALRKETGQESFTDDTAGSAFVSQIPAEWVLKGKVTESFNAVPLINSGESPMAIILAKTKDLKEGEIFEFRTPFVPAPIIEMLQDKGFKTCSVQENETFVTFVCRQ